MVRDLLRSVTRTELCVLVRRPGNSRIGIPPLKVPLSIQQRSNLPALRTQNPVRTFRNVYKPKRSRRGSNYNRHAVLGKVFKNRSASQFGRLEHRDV